MRIGILGGTFDPPHVGHLGAAIRVLDSGLTDEVWFVPCLAHRFGKAPAPFEDRLAMCELLIEGHKGLRVTDVEASINRPGYTIDLVRRLMHDFPEHTFRLIAGTDIYHQKDLWHQYDEIARLAPPIYVRRIGEPPIPEPVLPAPPEISSHRLRDVLAAGGDPTEDMPERVIEYVHEHGLYLKDDE